MSQVNAIGKVLTAIATKKFTSQEFGKILDAKNDTISSSVIRLAAKTKGKKFIEEVKIKGADGSDINIVDFLIHTNAARSVAECANLKIARIEDIKYTLPCKDYGNFLFYLISQSKTEASDNSVVDAIQILKDTRPDVIKHTSEVEKRTATHEAAHNGRMNIVQALLEADAKAVSMDGWTILTFAMNSNHWSTCLYLLEHAKSVEDLPKFYTEAKSKSYSGSIWGGDIFDDNTEHTIQEFIQGKMALKEGVKSIAGMAQMPFSDSDPQYIPDVLVAKSTEVLGLALDGGDGGL